MDVQSLSIVVTSICPNNCAFCVSKMRQKSPYSNKIEGDIALRRNYREDFIKRLCFARENGCNTVILTGEGEPIFDLALIERFAEWNQSLPAPFHWIELQTSGIAPQKFGGHLNDELLAYLRYTIGVTTISLSLSNIFDEGVNFDINRTPKQLQFDLEALCKRIKKYQLTLRLSLNMNQTFEDHNKTDEGLIGDIFNRSRDLGADQITFRKLYTSDNNTVQDQWIKANNITKDFWPTLTDYIKKEGRPLELLPFGARRYSVGGISVVVDDDCMNSESGRVLKYLILRRNCKLYTRWDDTGSLLF